MYLHALFNDCSDQTEGVADREEHLPSNGFINASLAMVAHAPLVADLT